MGSQSLTLTKEVLRWLALSPTAIVITAVVAFVLTIGVCIYRECKKPEKFPYRSCE